MKKVLLGSTAIVGVAMLAALPALAAEKPTVKVSGYVDFQTGWFDQDAEGTVGLGGTTDAGYQFITDSEVHIKASGQADNGLKYSAKIELETDQGTTGNSDEVVLTVSGNWGRLQLGAEDGAEDIMLGGHTGVGSAGSGGVDGDQSRWFLNTGGATSFVDITDTSDAVKITYYTPRFNGFQFGASFTPDRGQSGKGALNKLNGSFENHVGIGFNYVATHNDVDVALAVVASLSNVEPVAAAARNDVDAFGVGGTVGTKGFTFGGAFIDNGDGAKPTATLNDDDDVWVIGLGYTGFPVNLAFNYLHSEAGAAVSGAGDDELDIFSFSADYPLGPGWSLYGDLYFFDSDVAPLGVNAGAGDNDGTILVLGTQMNF